MSYCRFSSNNFKSDVYVYESCMGGFNIHVAANKIEDEKNIPAVPNFTEVDYEELVEAHAKQMEYVTKAKRVKIGLPEDGNNFLLPTEEECIDKLQELINMGYRVPVGVIETLMEEAEEKREKQGNG